MGKVAFLSVVVCVWWHQSLAATLVSVSLFKRTACLPARPNPGNMNQHEHTPPRTGSVMIMVKGLLGYRPHKPSVLITNTAKSIKPTRDSYSSHIFEQNFCTVAVFVY